MNALLADEWHRIARATVADGIVDVLIRPMPEQEDGFVRSVLRQIDDACGVAVRITDQSAAADLIVGPVTVLPNQNRGQLEQRGGQLHASWLASEMLYARLLVEQPPQPVRVRRRGRWRTRLVPQPPREQRTLGPTARQLITHEVLHGFGLSHPNGNGWDPRYDWTATLMSYRYDQHYSNAMTSLDLAALVEIWGPP